MELFEVSKFLYDAYASAVLAVEILSILSISVLLHACFVIKRLIWCQKCFDTV